MQELLKQFSKNFDGQFYFDTTMRTLYATDASAYREMPLAVAIPKSIQGIKELIRFASEDIGIANSFALPQATSAYDACHYIGMPECSVNLAQVVVYMAKSKKSNNLYEAYQKVQQDVKNYPNEPVPLHLRNAPTKLMKELNYGKGYKYTPHFDNPEDAKQEYMPEKLKNKKYLD